MQDSLELPEEWDWSNVDGVDFTGPNHDQLACGSCYDVAFTSMLESRIKIKYGKEQLLSYQFTLECNWLTEGCHGGWPLLSGFFMDSFYTVDASCAPYKASTAFNECEKYKHCPAVAMTENTHFVGGHYGGMSEEKIMKELRANGPVTMDFEAGHDFMMYKKGVLLERSAQHLQFVDGIQVKLQKDNITTDNDFQDYRMQW